jgi:hypothetical protein
MVGRLLPGEFIPMLTRVGACGEMPQSEGFRVKKFSGGFRNDGLIAAGWNGH